MIFTVFSSLCYCDETVASELFCISCVDLNSCINVNLCTPFI